MNNKKSRLKSWSPEEIVDLKEFFSQTRTKEEKDVFAKKLGRTFGAIYNKHWALQNPEKAKAQKIKDRQKRGTNQNNEVIQVTHVEKQIAPLINTIKIGKCTIETYSSKIKIDDVLIEV